MQYIIMLRSMTFAQKAKRILERGGIFASVTKAPQAANPGGCTYGVKIGQRNRERAEQLLREAGISITKVFAVSPTGMISGEET